MNRIVAIILAIVLTVASATAGIRHYCDYTIHTVFVTSSTSSSTSTAALIIENKRDYYGEDLVVLWNVVNTPQSRCDSSPKLMEQLALEMVLTDVGYVDASGNYYYYILDYQGNVRQVVDAQGEVLEQNDYYPYGGLFGESASRQNYKYSGKELETMNGLNTYDFHARPYYYPVLQFHCPDLLSENTPWLSPYLYCAANPIMFIDPTGKWNVYVHLEKDRSVSGYGVAVVMNNEGKEIFKFTVRAEGINGRDRLKTGSDTPLGIYDIPDNNAWISGGNRKAYGPNPRLNMAPEKGEIVESGRDLIRIHGGRQESYNSNTNEWEKDETPQLNKTEGCLRAFDDDMKKFKQLTDNLEKNNPTEKPEKVYILDDLDEFQKIQNK